MKMARGAVCLVLCALCCGQGLLALPSGGLVASQAGGLFAEGETIAFAADASTTGRWTVCDWRGERCKVQGAWRTERGARRLVLGALPPGYYRLAADGHEATFAVVRKDPCRNPNSPIAVDSAFTGCSPRGTYDCPWQDGDTYRVTAELMGRCGLVHTRERLFWPQMNPKPDVFAFDRFLETAKTLGRQGVVAEGMVHSAPAWAGGAGNRLPDDLVALHRFMERAVPAFAPYYDSWEFWNEPDLNLKENPVWEYAAAYKAFALGCRAAPADTVILTGSLSDIDPDGYATSLFDNGLAKYADALNIHTYEPPVALPAWHRRLHGYLKYGKVPHWPIWLTEAGTNLEGHGGRDSVRKGLKAHTAEQELVMAEFAPKFQILNRFGGIERTWSFLFGCYNERNGEKDWGMMRRDGSVKPIVAALATAASELGDAAMIGERKIGKGLRAFVYRRADGKGVMAFWRMSGVDTDGNGPVTLKDDATQAWRLAAPNGEYRVVDVMGTPRTAVSTNGALELAASRFPQYLSGLPDVAVDEPAIPVGTLRRYVAAPDEDLTVVLRPVLNKADFAISGRQSRAELLREEGRLRLDVWNLSAEEKRGHVSVGGGALVGLPDVIALPPWGRASFEVVYRPPEGAETAFSLKLGGRFNGRHVSEACVTVQHRCRFLSQMVSTSIPDIDQPRAWTRNDNADSYAIARDEAEKAVRFEVAWEPGKGKWFYPVLTLPKGDMLKGVAAVEFEVKTAQDKVENDCNGSFLMLVWPDAKRSRWLPCAAPTSVWERRLVWLPPEAADAIALRIGCNPLGRRLRFWVRNVRLLRSR